MKIAIVTDTHFGARNDNLNFNDYFYKFYDNIFFPTLKERDITTCVHMGDVVDRRKYISYRIANDFRSRFIERFKELNIDLHIIIGNHDTYYKNTNEVNSMNELVGEDILTSIYSEPQVVEFDDVPISISSDIVPEMQEYERTETTVVNSYVRPEVANYVDNLQASLHKTKGWRLA